MATYAAMIDRMDQNIGRLLSKLRSLDKDDNTLIFFASDNGGSSEVVRIGEGPIGTATRWASLKGDWANVSNTPFRKFKNYSHEGGICTPLIVHWPRRVAKPGSFVRQPGHLIDIMATVVDVTGAEYPNSFRNAPVTPMQGVSLTPLLAHESITRSEPIYWQWKDGKAIRLGPWKMVAHKRIGPWELYDMTKDRTERNDLAHLYPSVVLQLESRWKAWLASTTN